MALYNTTNAAVLDPPTLLPADCPLRDDVLANFKDDAPIAQWSRGFLRGHQWLEQLWEDLPDEVAEELDATLMALGFFSSQEMPRASTPRPPRASSPSRRWLTRSTRSCRGRSPSTPTWAGRLPRADGARYRYASDEQRQVDRNDPCPCGSGKKYKKCCGVTIH